MARLALLDQQALTARLGQPGQQVLQAQPVLMEQQDHRELPDLKAAPLAHKARPEPTVLLDRQVQPVPPEQQDQPALTARLALLEPQALTARLGQPVQPVLQAQQAQPVLTGQQDHRELLDLKAALLAHKARPEPMVLLDRLVQPVPPEQQALLVLMAQQDHRELLDLKAAQPVHKAPPDLMELQDQPAPPVLLERQALLVLMAQRDLKAPLDLQEDQPDHRGQLDHKALLGHLLTPLAGHMRQAVRSSLTRLRLLGWDQPTTARS